jgi:hypothetical protein
MNKSEFEKDLEIDPQALDVEAGMQGELFFKYAEKAIEARHKADEAKFRMEVIRAEVASNVRLSPEQYDLEKVTEAGVVAAVQTSKRVTNAHEKYLELKKDSDLLAQACGAMEQKKRMIEVLITLHGQEYFAGPAVPRSLPAAWKEEKEKRAKEVKKKTKIRRRGEE